MRIGFVGLGAMGGPMAANLLKAGFTVRGYDVASPAIERLVAAGGTAAGSPAEAARDADLLMLMVATADQADAVLASALLELRRGAGVILHATVPPAYATELGERLEAKGHPFLDAPVSGGQVGAEAGTLTIMASGSAAAFDLADKPLKAVAGKVFRLGDRAGIGSSVKMVNQLLCGVHIVAMAEALALGTKAGADPKTLFEVISNAAGRSWMFENRAPHVLARDFTPLSAVEIFVKDLGIVLETGKDLRFPLPLAATAHQQFLAAAGLGLGREDDSAVVKVYEALSGIEVKG